MDNPHVLVIGGGPAGSTTAALLAKSGVRVTLLERDKFPRYHIGESLLASVLSTLRLSGAYDAVAAHGFQINGAATSSGRTTTGCWTGPSWWTRKPGPGRCNATSSTNCCCATPPSRARR